MDRSTNWIEAVPIDAPSAKETADAFVKTWISRFGVPLYVVSDQGKNFESELFNHLAKTIGFHRIRTTAYHPQSNGKVERSHRTLKQIIKCHSKTDWFQALHYAC